MNGLGEVPERLSACSTGDSDRRGLLSERLRDTLPEGTARAWEALSPHLPRELYLAGGTAIAVHLRHRKSSDLDFFYHRAGVDLDELAERLVELGPFAVTRRAPGTLRGLFEGTKVEFLHADEVRPQRLLEEPTIIGGLRVAGRSDLMAMKLNAIGDRGELRDYFDVMKLDQEGNVSLEDGISLFLARYGLGPVDEVLTHLVRALGYLDDIVEDEALPVGKKDLTAWWRHRQAKLVRELGRIG